MNTPDIAAQMHTGDMYGTYCDDFYARGKYADLANQIGLRLLYDGLGVSPPLSSESLTLEALAEKVGGDITRIAFTRYEKPRHHPDVVDLSELESLPDEDESVAAIMLNEPHILNVLGLFAECSRILAPNSPLVFVGPNLASLQDRARFLWGESPREIDTLHPDRTFHLRPFTAHKLTQVLRNTGFEPTVVRSTVVDWRFTSERRIEIPGMAKIFPKLGRHLIVAARKIS